MFKVKLPIKYHTENSFELSKIGVEVKDYQTEMMTFYRIDYIEKTLDDKTQCFVGSGGERFTCYLSPEETEAIIDKAKANERL
jgi:hypothetical protein